MSRLETFERLKKILVLQLSVSPDQISEESDLIKDLGADSLDIAEVSMMIEEEFKKRISDDDMPKIKFVKDLVESLQGTSESHNKN